MHWLAVLRWIGPAMLLIAFLLNPGPPYQDPTPELDAKYRAEVARCERFAVPGIVVLGVGLVANLFVKETPLDKPNFLDRMYDRFIAD